MVGDEAVSILKAAVSAVQERRRPRDGARVPAGQQPTTIPLNEHQRRAEFPSHVVALELASLLLTTRRHRGVPVETCLQLVEGEGLVGEAPSEPSQPLLLVQHEAERPHADEVVGKRTFEEGGVAALLCGGPLSDELLYLPALIVHFFSPFVGSIYSNCVTYTRNHCYGDALAPCAAARPLPFPGILPAVMGRARPPIDPSLISPLAGASWLRIPPPLLITQRLCRVYLRGPAGRQVGGHERCRISDDDHEHERRPWHSVLHPRKALPDVVYERTGESGPQSDAKPEAQQRDEGGLDQEGEPNLPPLETQGPHHPDLLAPLHHRAGRDHAQSADADHQPQAHETPQEQKDGPARRVAVPDDLGSQLCLEAVLGEVLLQGSGRSCGVRPISEVEVVALGRNGTAGQSFEHLLRGHDLSGEGGRAFEHPYYAQFPRPTGLGVFDSQVEVVRQALIVGVEAGELDGRLHRGTEGRGVTLGGEA